jgi:hypothetical protein
MGKISDVVKKNSIYKPAPEIPPFPPLKKGGGGGIFIKGGQGGFSKGVGLYEKMISLVRALPRCVLCG